MITTTTATTGGATPPPVVRVADVSKAFGATRALRDVQLEVLPGQVHALVGRNGAGKSTLVSILTGLQQQDSGTVEFAGQPAPPVSDRDGWHRLAACVYQKLTVIDGLSVAENLFLNRQAQPGRPIRWGALRRRAADLLKEWELDLDPSILAGTLTVEQKQLVEIARALSYGARFVILDEPTARLDAAAIGRLFEKIRALRDQGITFLYISHHLQEIFELCDHVTVFRDARWIRSDAIGSITRQELVEAMTGAEYVVHDDPRPPAPAPTAAPVLVTAGLTGDGYSDVGFEVLPGEIVGLAGGGGSGKFEIADAIVGLGRPQSGEILVNGHPLRPGSVPRSQAAGIGFVPKDRHAEGFVEGLSIAENATMSVPRRLGPFGLMDPRRRSALARELVRRLDIVPPVIEQAVGALSGGNQQKVVAGRAIAADPRVLVMMAPTAGVDVRSKDSLMAAAVDSALGGAGVLIVSDDLDDLSYCHRVLVLFRGRLVHEYRGTWDDNDLVASMEGVVLQ